MGEEQANDTAARTVIIGAGPAGLTAAYQLGKAGHTATVLEASWVCLGSLFPVSVLVFQIFILF